MKIEDFGYDGEGVGHENGKVCFVPYVIVGEEVEYKKLKETSSFIKCVLTNVTKSSPKRQTPPCQYFTKCGGCNFQHISYEDELDLKSKLLVRQLEKVTKEADIEVIKAKREYCYRNKIKLFPCEKGLGLKQSGSDKVVHICKCLLIDDKMNYALDKLNSFVKNNRLQSKLENVYIRKFNEEYCVFFKYRKETKLDYSGLDLVLGDFNIFYSTNDGIKSYRNKSIKSKDFDLEVEYDIRAFKQVNDETCEMLYDKVQGLVKGKKVLNAYSGAGILSALLARKANMVTGVELGVAEHESAQKLKEINNICNLVNINDDCANVEYDGYDCVIVDPPRKGLENNVCEALNLSNTKSIIYISCNRASLVRDLQRLTNYSINKVTLYDMFPRTASFEILVQLTLKSC